MSLTCIPQTYEQEIGEIKMQISEQSSSEKNAI